MNPTRLTQTQRKAATRNKLRDAAARVFARQGLGGVSIDRLSEAAGFSRGAFYAHYADKQGLLLELLAASHETEIQAWTDLAGSAGDVAAMFAEMEQRFNRLAAEQDWWLLHGELQLHAQRDAAFGRQYQQFSDAVMRRIEHLLREIAARAAAPATLDVAQAAVCLRALGLGLMFERSTHTSPGAALVAYIRLLVGQGEKQA